MEKYKNKMILETFVIFFTFATPTNPIPDLEVGHPQGALALATAAASDCYRLLLYSSNFFIR